jgi:hypothetical protein
VCERRRCIEGVSPQVWLALEEARRLCDWYVAGCACDAEDVWDILMNYTENETILRWVRNAKKEEY